MITRALLPPRRESSRDRSSEGFHGVARTPRLAPRPTSPVMIRSSRVRASISRVAASALVAFLLAAALPCADAKKQKAPPARAVKSDLKYVRCQVCEEVAKVLSREASTLREEKGAKLTEADVLDKVEKVCDVETVEGEWLLKHDLVEKGDALAMVHMGDDVYGKCNSECKTMQLACEKIVADRDTDVAEALFTGGEAMKRAAVTQFLCRDEDEPALGACLKKAPKLPKDRPKGPKFEPVDKKDIDMQRMMKTMRDAGMGGMQMYGRDDMDAMMNGEYDDDDDEDGGAGGFDPASFGGFGGAADAPAPSLTEKLADAGAALKEAGENAWRGAKRLGADAWSTITSAVSSRKAEDEYEL